MSVPSVNPENPHPSSASKKEGHFNKMPLDLQQHIASFENSPNLTLVSKAGKEAAVEERGFQEKGHLKEVIQAMKEGLASYPDEMGLLEALKASFSSKLGSLLEIKKMRNAVMIKLSYLLENLSPQDKEKLLKIFASKNLSGDFQELEMLSQIHVKIRGVQQHLNKKPMTRPHMKVVIDCAYEAIKKGYIIHALELAELLPADSEIHSEVYRHLAKECLAQGAINKALEIAHYRLSPLEKVQALKEIAIALAKQGDIKAALEVANSLTTYEGTNLERAYVIPHIAEALVKQGKLGEALEMLQQLQLSRKIALLEKNLKFRGFYHVAKALAQQGDLNLALEVIARISELPIRSGYLRDLGIELAAEGRLDEALKIAEKIPADHSIEAKDRLYQHLVRAALAIQDRALAKALIINIIREENQQTALEDIATAQLPGFELENPGSIEFRNWVLHRRH